jgi:hypothetical protein
MPAIRVSLRASRAARVASIPSALKPSRPSRHRLLTRRPTTKYASPTECIPDKRT